MIFEELAAKRPAARKSKDKATLSILNVAIGEIQLETSRSMPPKMSEGQAIKIVRKLVESNRETLSKLEDGIAKETLIQEIDILEGFLPKEWDEDQIFEFIENASGLMDSIANAKSDGEATGKAMKVLKSSKAPVAGKTVAAVVKSIRS